MISKSRVKRSLNNDTFDSAFLLRDNKKENKAYSYKNGN